MKVTTQTSPVRVLLCDDHHLVREGIRLCLEEYSAVSIVGEAVDGNNALTRIEELRPEVVLMDVNMPGMNGLEATRIVSKRFPETKVIALTVHDNREYVSEIIRSGARGYVLKNTSPDNLVAAIQAVRNGGNYFNVAGSKALLQKSQRTDTTPLSKREKELLKLYADGLTSQQIAVKLNITTRTASNYRARLMKRLKVRTVAELSRMATERGLF